MAACGTALASESPLGSGRVARAIEDGLRCIESFDRLTSDQFWFLLQGQTSVSDPRLDDVVEKMRSRLVADEMSGLVGPGPTTEPSRTGPPEWQAIMSLMQDAVACRNSGEPSRELDFFVRQSHEGYLQTHQILVIEWAKSVNCRIPPVWIEIEAELARAVAAELRAERSFSDLFVQRVVTVGLAGMAELLEESSLYLILDAQDPDGCWRSPRVRSRIRFRGRTLESTTSEIPSEHTTSLAVLALHGYRAELQSRAAKVP